MKFLILVFIIAVVFMKLACCKSIKCDCDCKTKPSGVICARDPKTGDTDTFLNLCQMNCYNCTHSKNLHFIQNGDCSTKKKGKKIK